MAKDLLQALNRIKKSTKLTKEFSANPEATLKTLDVDTTNLQITMAKKDEILPPVQLHKGASTNITVCGSVGYIACASVGGELF